MIASLPAAAHEAIASLLGRAEELLALGSWARAGACLEALDRALLACLRSLERMEPGGAGRELMGYAFYRRGLLERLVRQGAFAPELLRALYGSSSSGRLILLVTRACQLRCSYCRAWKHPSRMSLPVAEAAVRLLFRSLREEVELQFFGGEPLLAFQVVRQATILAESLARRSGKKLRLLLTTNALALSREALDFLRERGFFLEASCDGSRRTQLAQRAAPGGLDYYDRLLGNLERLKSSGVPYQVTMVVLPERAGELLAEFRHLARLGHRRIQVNYALGCPWGPEQASGLLRQMQEAARLASAMGVELVNMSSRRREPVVLNGELTVDCDGGIFRETGLSLEEDFQAMKERFFVEEVARARFPEYYGATPFDNLALLTRAYGRGRLRGIVLNNLELGIRLREGFRDRE